MKPILALLLCLCLMFSTMGALAAAPVNFTGFQQTDAPADGTDTKTLSGAVSVGDTLYLLTQSTLEKWVPGDAQPTVVLTDFVNSDYVEDVTAESADMNTADAGGDAAAETDADTQAALDEVKATVNGDQSNKPSFNKLIAGDQAAYGLNTNTGAMWKIADANGPLSAPERAAQLDWSRIRRQAAGDENTHVPTMYEVTLVDGVVYAALIDWNDNGQTFELARWTFATGALIEDTADVFLRSFTPYKDGLLLCKYFDEANSWDEKTQTQKNPSLATYNTATGEIKILFDFDSYDIYGIRYSAANDTLYYISGSTAYSLPGLQKPAKISAYLPNRIWEDAACCLLPSGMYAVADYNGLIVRALDQPGIENGALTIYGEYGSAGHQAYLAANPQALVTCSDSYFNSLEAFTNAMVSGTNTVDVLRMDSDYTPLTRLIDKGYALDLSGYPDLVALVNAMDPNLTRLCIKDGKVYGIPVEIYGNAFGYNQQTLETLGITADDLPKNLMELLDFVDNWEADYAEDHPDVMLTDSGSVKDTILTWILSNYTAYMTRQGETVSFDTDLFRKIMARFDSVDFSFFEKEETNQGDEYWNRAGLLSLYTSVTYPGQYRYDQKFLPLPLDDGLDPVYPTTVQYMIINPRTTHLEQAIQYLTIYAQNLDPSSTEITLFPDHNDPVVNTSYEKDLADWKKNLADYQEMLKTAAPEDQASLKQAADYFSEMIADGDQSRYTVSAEEIATYRQQVAPHLVVTGQTPLNTWDDNGNNELYVLESQYLQGAMKVDQFIREMDKRMRMMQLEDQ